MMVLFHFLPVIMSILIGLSRNEAVALIEQPEGCLMLPYISSIDDFRIVLTDRTSQRSFFDLLFKVDYNYSVGLSYLSIIADSRNLTLGHIEHNYSTGIKIKPDEHDNLGEIVYSRANYPVEENEIYVTRYINYTKEIALRETRRLYSQLEQLDKRLQAKALDVAKPCSRAYIYDADFVIPLQPHWDGRFLYVRIHRSMICYLEFTQSKPISFEEEFKHFTGDLIGSENIISAAYSEPFAIFALASSSLRFTHQDLAKILLENTGKSRIHTIGLVSLTHKPGASPQNDMPILQLRSCGQLIHALPVKRRMDSQEFDYPVPTRTLSRSITNKNEILTVYPENGYQVISFDLNIAANPNEREALARKLHPRIGIFNDSLPIKAMAIYSFSGSHRSHIIYGNSKEIKYLNADIGLDYQALDRGSEKLYQFGPIPDDITYWSSCSKMVSFYGFLYALHDHRANILEDPGSWHILPAEHFDFPIEAAHADGDDFYFFIKATTLYHMVADNSQCGSLKFLQVNKNHHYSQFFGLNLRNGFYVENRYYDGQKWIPAWDYNPYQALAAYSTEDGASSTLLFVVVGLIGSIILIAAILVAIKYFHPMLLQFHAAAHSSKGAIPAGQQNFALKMPASDYQGMASAMPLFSETVGRHASKETIKTPSGKVKSKRSKSKSKKSASPLKQTKSKQLKSKSPTKASKSAVKMSPKLS